MATRTTKKTRAAKPATKKAAKPVGAAARMRAKMSREAKIAYREVEGGVKHLERSVAEIQRGLVRAEKQIEKDARAKVRELRRDAKAQLGALKSAQRDVAGLLRELAVSADDSWQDVRKTAGALVGDTVRTANSVVKRFRKAIGA